MTAIDWADHHWFFTGWCMVILTAGFASMLHGLGARPKGCACVPCDLEHDEEEDTSSPNGSADT